MPFFIVKIGFLIIAVKSNVEFKIYSLKESVFMSNTKTIKLVEGAVMVALALVLSFIKVFHLPWGGSITLLSMLPIVIYSIRNGVKWGMLVSVVYALLQMFIDLGEVVSWGLTASALIGTLILDYILAFSVLGLAGMLRKKGIAGAIAGIVITIALRYAFHVISGSVIFHSVGAIWDTFSTDNSWIYSSLYNGAYMLPEMVFTVIGAVILLCVPQTKKLIVKD